MKARIEAELPFYFGSGRELFGFYHPAAPVTGTAVLLCPPFGVEQIRCHRLYRQLAHGLAESGLPVLRFDYFGTGDSAGDSREFEWTRCLADVVTAAAELRTRHGGGRVLAFGARLGANAALATAQAARLAGVVTWDAITDGAALVRQYDRMQEALKVDLNRFEYARPELDVGSQWPGFERGDGLRDQLQALRLLDPGMASVWLSSAVIDEASQPDERYARKRVSVDVAPRWDEVDCLELAILSHPLLDAVKRHLKEMA
ncbi:serine aminopeptidase domain-containing protein [Dyella terrae]|uniref:serine aminopeptidase domain-containing protein n=1 Tax=Dyella terrae TaxID=522259 RepID=UPI001EFE7CE1|nr:alpha/beta hydrolase [Dyella terrae]ULU24040.1 alpha/beta hydrolase [Dyella terrae]